MQLLDFFVTFDLWRRFEFTVDGSYAAANTFMDALVRYRQQQGQTGAQRQLGYTGQMWGMVTNFEGSDRAVTVAGSMSSQQSGWMH